MNDSVLNKRILLNNGCQMPTLGLGTANLGNEDDTRKAINYALECGYRAFDTAYYYRNEVSVGKELNAWLSAGKLRREEVFITTKLLMFGNRSADVEKFMMRSLEQLSLDYVDLYLFHTPFAFKKDPLQSTEIEIDFENDLVSVWKAMEEQVDAGRTKAIGLANFNSNQILRILKIARIKPTSLQIEVHCYMQQKPLIDFCNKHVISVIAYSPLAAPYTDDGKDLNLLNDSTVLKIATKNKKTPAQILLKFLLDKGICIIPKPDSPQHTIENSQLDFSLSAEDTRDIESLDRGKEGRVYHYTSEFKGLSSLLGKVYLVIQEELISSIYYLPFLYIIID